MRKNVFGRQFKRDKNQRKALFKGLLSSLVLNERIKTTHEKAKAIKADADKLITKAKKGGLHSYNLLEPDLTNKAVRKVIDDLAPRFTQRQGGYTRITKIGRRGKDNAAMAQIEWTETPTALALTPKSTDKQIEAIESTAKVSQKEKKETKPKAPKTEKKETKATTKKETKKKA